MAEKVSTGGNVTFAYDKSYNPKLGEQEKHEIHDAYDQYYERRRREKRRRNLLVILGVLILVLLIIIFFVW